MKKLLTTVLLYTASFAKAAEPTVLEAEYQLSADKADFYCNGDITISTNSALDYIAYSCSVSDVFADKVYQLKKPSVYNRYDSFEITYKYKNGIVNVEFTQTFKEGDVFREFALKESMEEKALILLKATNSLMTNELTETQLAKEIVKS